MLTVVVSYGIMVPMTKRRHDQKPDPRLMVCSSCHANECENCVDRLRRIYADDNICTCTRKRHVEKRDRVMTEFSPALTEDVPEKFFSRSCAFCTDPVDLDDPNIWREIVGWVHGPKRDGLSLRAATGQVGHDACVHKAKQGEPASTPSLFEEEENNEAARDFTS